MTKKAKIGFIQKILYKYPINQLVSEISDKEYLLSIFENHPDWEIKKGVGVDEIIIRKTQYNNRCFYLIRQDGSETDISFNQAINGRSTKKSDIKAACRSAIRPLISEFKKSNVIIGKTTCPFSNQILTEDNIHIDHHDFSFNEVFETWIQKYNIDDLFSKLNNTAVDKETKIYFLDLQVIDDFIIYHNQNTHLRAVSKQANLSLLKRK